MRALLTIASCFLCWAASAHDESAPVDPILSANAETLAGCNLFYRQRGAEYARLEAETFDYLVLVYGANGAVRLTRALAQLSTDLRVAAGMTDDDDERLAEMMFPRCIRAVSAVREVIQ